MFSRLSFKDCNCLLGKNICYKQVGSEIKQSQIKSDTSHKRLNFRKERKKEKVKTYTNASKTACDKLKYLAPKRHKSSYICTLSPCLRVKKTPNKDLSRQGWLCWPLLHLFLHTTQPSCEITALPGTEGTAPFTSFIPWTEPRLLENMLHQSEDMWTELCATETEHSFSGEDTIRGQSSQIDV